MEAFLARRFADRPHLTRPVNTPYGIKAAIAYYRGRLEAVKAAEREGEAHNTQDGEEEEVSVRRRKNTGL